MLVLFLNGSDSYIGMKNNPESPLEVYMRHIAHANHIILNRVINEIQNQNNNGNFQG